MYIERGLWLEEANGPVRLTEKDVGCRSEPVVVLGEAGMGKTTLLSHLGGPTNRPLRAEMVLRHPAPERLLEGQNLVIIDALDEAPGGKDGAAVDEILAKLDAAGRPRFIISCRVADWQGSVARQKIKDWYSAEPLELRLAPFDDDDAECFLADTLGRERAKVVISHYQERDLQSLLGNPNTLKLLGQVGGTQLPESRAQLFHAAVDALWPETNAAKHGNGLGTMGREAVLDASGRVFATMILAGYSETSASVDGTSQLRIAEVPDPNVRHVLDSRLFEGGNTWIHRSIAEYLGARWLAKQADWDRQQRRVIALFGGGSQVPTSLRGLFAWLPHFSVGMAAHVIRRDPMAVIEYGDADDMAPEAARLLLDTLVKLQADNPRFRDWKNQSARSLVKGPMLQKAIKVLNDPATSFDLSTLLLQQLKHEAPSSLLPELRQMTLDVARNYTIRRLAADALVKNARDVEDWPVFIEFLQNQAASDSLRVAIDIVSQIGFDQVDNYSLARLIAAEEGLTLCSLDRETEDSRSVGRLWGFEHNLPVDRIDGFLDGLTELTSEFHREDAHDNPRDSLSDLICSLAVRRGKWGPVQPSKLWSWLAPLESEYGYSKRGRDDLTEWLASDDQLRRGIQRIVLIDRPSDKSLWIRAMRLQRAFAGLAPDEDDIVALLPLLGSPKRPSPNEIDRWKDLLSLIGHGPDRGTKARAAAAPFAATRKRLQAWLSKLAEPRIQPWEVRQAKRAAKREQERLSRWAKHRAGFEKAITRLSDGDFGIILGPAQAYVGVFSDMDRDLLPVERLTGWLGPDLTERAFAGFEKFLLTHPPKPTAVEIAESNAQSRRWNAEYILTAALAERVRTGRGLDDLPDERLVAGALVFRQSGIESHSKLDGVQAAIEAALRSRPGLWEKYWRTQIEPQLQRSRVHVEGLYELMWGNEDVQIASELAGEWLAKYPDCAGQPEIDLIDRRLSSGLAAPLRALVGERLSQDLSSERRSNWLAVAFLVSLRQYQTLLDTEAAADRNLLWNIRERIEGSARQRENITSLGPEWLAWIVRTFRATWPYDTRPSGRVTMGDTNDWDASEFISRSISRLAGDWSESAVEALHSLRDASKDSYTELLIIASSQQARTRADALYRPLTIQEVNEAFDDKKPTTVEQLRSVVIEELAALDRRLNGNETDSWKLFWPGGKAVNENQGRDIVVDLLGPNLPFGIVVLTESDMPADNRADLAFLCGHLRLPGEVKGQWHSDLWHAADSQLDRLYGKDHRADGRGIYLVLWFGRDAKVLRSPGRGKARPGSASGVEDELIARSPAAQDGRVTIKVLDVSKR